MFFRSLQDCHFNQSVNKKMFCVCPKYSISKNDNEHLIILYLHLIKHNGPLLGDYSKFSFFNLYEQRIDIFSFIIT